jgi:hypothetical protein
MGSRITYPPLSGADFGGDAGFPPNKIFTVNTGISRLSLSSITEYTKIEIEYGFALDSVDKIQGGRYTFLWDGVGMVNTSHEIEESENLGEVTTVSWTPYKDGNDIGIEFDNQSGEVFNFAYNFVNKFLITYTPNIVGVGAWSTEFAGANSSVSGYIADTGGLGNAPAIVFSDKSVTPDGKMYFEIRLNSYSPFGLRGAGILFRDTPFDVAEDFITSETVGDIFAVNGSSSADGVANGGTAIYSGGVSIGAVGGTGWQAGRVLCFAFDFDNNVMWSGTDGDFGVGADLNNPATGIDISSIRGAFTKFWIGVHARLGIEFELLPNPINLPVGYTNIID